MNELKAQGRIVFIDVLRGFALLGIAIVHITEQYYAGAMPDQYMNVQQSVLDNIISGLIGIFITGKFYMIFSFLFGLSFFIQLSKTDGSASFLARFAWRLIILFAIGMVHHLHYRGDILSIYAVLGFGLLLFYKVPDRLLLIVALLLVFNVPALVTRLVQTVMITTGTIQDTPLFSPDQAPLVEYFNTVKSGTYVDILKANFYEFKAKMDFQVVLGRIYITLGLFLLGLYAGRKKVFESLAEHLGLAVKLIKYSLITVGVCVVIGVGIFGTLQALQIKIPDRLQFAIGGFIFDVFNTSLAAIYVSLLAILFQKPKWNTRLLIFNDAGRMGLTTYLMQTMFGFFFFFSQGFGLLTELSTSLLFLIALVFYTLQILFGQWWFRHFQYGFFEWLWRGLTYFKFPSLLFSGDSADKR